MLRQCLWTLFLIVLLGSLAGAPVTRAQDTPAFDHPLFTGPIQTPTDPPVDLQHLALALRLDAASPHLEGTARFELLVLTDTLRSVDFRAIGPSIERAELLRDTVHSPLSFERIATDTVRVRLDTVLIAGDLFWLELAFRAAPGRGWHTRSAYAWTTGTPGSVPYWLPVPVSPADRFSASLTVTVPGMNPVLAAALPGPPRPQDQGTTYGFYSPYLITTRHLVLATGPLDLEQQGGSRNARTGITVAVPPPLRASASRTFGHLPEVIQFLTDFLRHPFPVDHMTVAALPGLYPDAVSGPGLALLDTAFLLDARGRHDINPDTTLARLLAGQWFGNLITARHETDRWLEDAPPYLLGARFAAHIWGDDAFALRMESLRQAYLEETSRYVRPLVWDRWEDPAQMKDAHSRMRGAWVLYMIYRRIGDDAFRRVLNRFLYAQERSGADTEDLRRALEAETGTDWSAFFDQWVYAAGHPILELSYEHARDTLYVTVRQVQTGPLVPEVFDAEVFLEAGTFSGTQTFPIRLDRREARYAFPVALPPRYVALDAGHTLLAEIRTAQDAAAWVAQLRDASSPVLRLRAARALRGHLDHPDLLFGLRSAFGREPEAPVRAAIVQVMSALPPSPRTGRALLEALNDPSPHVRQAALAGLGRHPDTPGVIDRALAAAHHDSSAAVQAAAVEALVHLEAPQATNILRSALVTPSYREVIRRTALALLPGASLPPAEVLRLALPFTEPDQPADVRRTAIDVLGHLAPERRAALDALWRLLTDPDPRIRRATLEALAPHLSDTAWRRLEATLAGDPDPGVRFTLARLRAGS